MISQTQLIEEQYYHFIVYHECHMKMTNCRLHQNPLKCTFTMHPYIHWKKNHVEILRDPAIVHFCRKHVVGNLFEKNNSKERRTYKILIKIQKKTKKKFLIFGNFLYMFYLYICNDFSKSYYLIYISNLSSISASFCTQINV